jgi:cysteinyl-tRNA synthetase
VETAIAEARAAFIAAMDDDFNSAAALAGLFEFNKIVNTLLNAETPATRGALEAIDAFYRDLNNVLAIFPDSSVASDTNAEREAGLIQFLIELRAEARQRKDYAAGDAIRKRLAELGVTLEDGKEGTRWKI